MHPLAVRLGMASPRRGMAAKGCHRRGAVELVTVRAVRAGHEGVHW